MSFVAEIEFCLNFLKKADTTKKSTIFSSASLLNSLAIIYAGSDKATAEEIAKVIGKDTNKEQIINYYSELSHKLNESDEIISDEEMSDQTEEEEEENFPDEEDIDDEDEDEDEEAGEDGDEDDAYEEDFNDKTPLFKIINVNGLFINPNIELQPNFEKIVSDKFFIQMQKVNYMENEKTSEMINNYVKDSTNGKIDRIVEKESLSSDTSCVLVNAIYFIAKWYNSFKPRFKGTFYSNPKREINFMNQDLHSLNFTQGKTWEAVGIPYKGCKYWMFFVLPKKEECNLNELIASMDFSMFKQWTTRKAAALNLTLPLFEISCDFDLSQTLPTLGIRDLFCPQKCDLSQMFLSQHLIDKSLHKAVIKVNEFGTKASAATCASMVPRSGKPPTKFVVDHPFLYFIVSMDEHEDVKNILFSGTFL